MRLIVASCSATYSGRGDTQLRQRTRAIIIKNDGSIAIHNDASNKPLNYMGKGSVYTDSTDDKGNRTIVIESRKENLTITLHEVITDTGFELDLEDEGLIRDGAEEHLQAWIAEHPECLGEGYALIQREYPTGSGPVDLMMTDGEGKPVAVEVKRVAMLGTVYQVLRYVDALNQESEHEDVRGVIAALDIRPKTAELAAKRGIECITLPVDWNNSGGAQKSCTPPE